MSPLPSLGAGKNMKAGGFSISVQTFYKQCHSLTWKSSQMCCWCLHIKFCNLGRSSYCVEEILTLRNTPSLGVDSADLAEQIWLKIAGSWKKGLTSFWWALNEALSSSWHVKKMSADLLFIFCRLSLFLRKRPSKNENEQTICETWNSLWYEATLMCRTRPKLACIVHRSPGASFCRQLRRSRSDVIAQEPNLLPHYIKKTHQNNFPQSFFCKSNTVFNYETSIWLVILFWQGIGHFYRDDLFFVRKIEGKKLGPL